MSPSPQFDLLVVGGGAAGLMCAGQLASRGGRVVVLEKMPRPARKLRISGKGRCNLTNDCDLEQFLTHIHPNGPFLRQVFRGFFRDDLRSFLERLGVTTVVERGGRVFPKSGDAREVVDALVNWVHRYGATIRTGVEVSRLCVQDGQITGVELAGTGEFVPATAVLLATGGASYPRTGSTGDGYRMALEVGHTVVPLKSALVPLETNWAVPESLWRFTLRNIDVALWIGGKKKASERGEATFEKNGIGGALPLTYSRQVSIALEKARQVELRLDLKTGLSPEQLDRKLQQTFEQRSREPLHSILRAVLPKGLVAVALAQTTADANTPGHRVPATIRKQLVQWIKDWRLPITGVRPLDEGLVTAGGVSLKEVDPNTLESRRVSGLHFAGEVLNLDGETGGYNLQIAFSTGVAVAQACATRLS